MLITDQLIRNIFTVDDAQYGQQLFEAGAVHEVENRSTAEIIQYSCAVSDDVSNEDVSIAIDLDATTLRTSCTCKQGRLCPHLAALMHYITADLMHEASGNASYSDEDIQRSRLNSTLSNYTVAQLRAIAKRQGWKPKGVRKAEVVKQVADHIFHKLQLGTFLDGVAPSQLELLGALHLIYNINLGITEADAMHVNNKMLNNRHDWKSMLNGLVEYGVLYRDKETYEDAILYLPVFTINTKDIPVSIYKLPPHRKIRYPHSTQRAPQLMFSTAISQLCQILSGGEQLLENPPTWEEPATNLQAPWINEWPTKGDELNPQQNENPLFYLARQQYLTLPINPHVLHPESRQLVTGVVGNSDKAEWMIDLLRINRLISTSTNKRGMQLNGARYEAWAQSPPEAQLKSLYSTWLGLGSEQYELRMLTRTKLKWELWRAVHPGLYFTLFHNDISGARNLVLRFLAQLGKQRTKTGNDWFNLDSLIKKIGQVRPDCYHTIAGPEAWGFKLHGKRIPYTNNRYWEETYGALIRSLFEGPLYWMGVVDLLERKERTTAFRLTAMGRWLLDPSQPLADIISADTDVQTKAEWIDGDILKVTPGAGFAVVLNTLTRYMTLALRTRNQYHLSNLRLESAFSQGDTADTVITAFEAIGAPLPTKLQTQVRLNAQRYGSVHLYEDLTVIEFSDDYALPELRAGKIITSEHIIHEFSPRLIVIHDVHAEKILKALQKKNYTPKVA